MRRIILGLAVASCAFPAIAQAQDAPPPPPAPGAPRSAPMPPRPMPGGMLMRADANGDGIVTREEVMARADARFDRMDANHDGVISPDERPMRRWMRGRSGGDMPPPPRPRPAAADGAAPPPPPPPSGPGGRDRGKPVTRQMERARVAAEFDRADRNHDGRIDQSEIAALRDMQAGPRGPRGDMPPPPPAPPPR